MTIRYGIIGCRGFGTTHADAVVNTDGVELVAGANRGEEGAREFAETYDCAAYTDHVEMIRDADVDAVSVCTPSGTHADISIDAMEAGADVLCEKPLDTRAERMDRMIAAAEEHDATLAGVFHRRTGPGAQRAKRAVESGEIEELVFGDVAVKWHRTQGYYDGDEWRGTRELDGGVLMNQAIHGIDLLQWLAGGVERVNAVCRTVGRDVEVETAATVLLEFENGATGTIQASTVTYPQREVRIELDGEGGAVQLKNEEIAAFETTDGVVDVPDTESGPGSIDAIVADFVEALETGREPMIPARDARTAVDIVLAAYESSETGEWVDVH